MNTKKNYIFSSIWALFLHYSENKNFSRKPTSVTFFIVFGFYYCQELQNKATEKIQKKS